MNNTTGTNEEKGDVLLFLHGWGCDGTIFKGLASTFKGVRCLTPDFRGFGCNPPPDRPWTIEDYARDVAEYLEQLHCGKVTVIAHSFGCRVATVLAAEYPRYVKAMLFTGPAGFRRFSLKRWLSVTEYKFKKKLCALGILPFRCLERYGSEDYRNASPEMRSTFLKVVNSDVSKELKAQSARINDTIIMLLAGKTYGEISTPEGKVSLKHEIAARLNQILGAPRVIRVYFTNFVVE